MRDLETHGVEASRLNDRDGDIHSSYSADTIAMESRIRKPFQWQGRPFVAVWFCPGPRCEAYALVPSAAFNGVSTTYKQKTGTDESAEVARHDPNGFYHGMAVKSGQETLVMCGPPLRFVVLQDVPASPQQLTLFMDHQG